MQERGVAADTIMYNQVLGACAKANMVSERYRLLQCVLVFMRFVFPNLLSYKLERPKLNVRPAGMSVPAAC
jgi:hypothetical protein